MKTATVRINKYLADLGIATRKDADRMIEKGLVTINGRKAILGDQVGPKDLVETAKDKDKKSSVYFAYYKPVGIVTSTAQGNEREIADDKSLPHGVFPIGRLDKDSEGLIILTNDGRITDRLLNPERDHEKEYIVETDRALAETFVKRMSGGVRIDGYTTRACIVKKIGAKKFSIVLTEGKKRQIRRMCEALGYQVKSLKRIRIMNVQLGNLKPSAFRKIEKIELATLLTQLKLH